MKTMKPLALLAGTALLILGVTAGVAAESTKSQGHAPEAAVPDKGKPTEPAECPIKKTIDGKTYCFQNDPALTKPQGGGD